MGGFAGRATGGGRPRRQHPASTPCEDRHAAVKEGATMTHDPGQDYLDQLRRAQLTRRRFLQGTSLAALGAVLAACGATATPTTAPSTGGATTPATTGGGATTPAAPGAGGGAPPA